MSNNKSHLLDALQAAEKAVEFRGNQQKDAFLKDEKTQAAVLHELMILGEAVKRLSEQFRKAHPEIAWRKIAGLRDKLIHGYDDVNLQRVWKTITDDIPGLIQQIRKLSGS